MSDEDRRKWDARYATAEAGAQAPPTWLAAHDDLFPRQGRGLDLASGAGRFALWAARRGLDVTAVDISPVGLAKVRAAAPGIQTLACDLADGFKSIGALGPFALITCFHYRQPSLWPPMRAALAPGGLLVAELLTVKNLERHDHPSRRWLVESGELSSWAGRLERLVDEEGWFGGRHSARLVARRPLS